MNRIAALTVVTSLAGLLTACGQGAPLGDGKRGAAQAAFTAMRPANDRSSSWNPLTAAEQPLDVSLATTVKGRSSGSARVALEVSTDSIDAATHVGVAKNIEYSDFSDDGKTRYNGSLKVALLVNTSSSGGSTSATVKYKAKGHIVLSGEVDDTLDIDTTIDLAATAYESSSGSASVKLNGAIVTRSGRYDYRDESLAVDVSGHLPADLNAKP
jgi:hypothetical protein